MESGPWCEYWELVIAAEQGSLPRAFDGKRPVAIERTSKQARFLYTLPPSDREPTPYYPASLPEYIYLGG